MIKNFTFLLALVLGLFLVNGTGFHYPYEIWSGNFTSDYNFTGNQFNIINSNVGIGTVNPSVKFQVVDSSSGINTVGFFKSTDIDSSTQLVLANDAKNWNFKVDGADFDKFKIRDDTLGQVRLTIDSSGFIGIDKTNPQSELDINGRWYVDAHGTSPASGAGMFGSFNPSVNNGIGLIQAYDYSTSSAKNISIQSAGGNVGIGTTTPNVKLDVTGNIEMNNQLVATQSWVSSQGYADGDITEVKIGSNTCSSGSCDLTTLDGSGSGLDADLLDGISSESFTRSDTDDTLSGRYLFTNTNGIQWESGVNRITHNDGGGNDQPVIWGDTFSVLSNGVQASAFYYSSDVRLKDNIELINSPIEKLKKINGVSFNWKKDRREDIGVIAQDVEKVFPQAVKIDPNTGMKTVEYGNLVAPLIEAVKDQQNQIDELKEQLEILKNE